MSDDKKKDLDTYERILLESKENLDRSHYLPEEQQKKIVQIGKNTARMTNIMITLACLLLIIPCATLATYLYYGFGGRADELIEVTGNTIYVTEPNVSIEEMDIEEEIGFFEMKILFDVYKKIGMEDYRVGSYDVDFTFDEARNPKKTMMVERPLAENPTAEEEILVHPKSNIPFYSLSQWKMLKGLPDGTVSELYISFTKTMKQEDIEQLLPNNVELRWIAVDTGVEEKMLDQSGSPVSPIGYPAQVDTTTWSPFNGRDKSNEEVFMDILRKLEKREDVAAKISRAKNLSLDERIAYIEQNGIHAYGAVVTGPTPELRKMEKIHEIHAMKVGEVKLWNWE
ncbi:anti-sigma factor [Peribacillus alkalitolerans]|uniref:anti-sigma factor n=1 Tax=Peribacillus alkalitolerans TaxID=1550385 RepID=UPI0013D67A1B|nr:anti-sigma factor [Peribacillus alkalitolerans]